MRHSNCQLALIGALICLLGFESGCVSPWFNKRSDTKTEAGKRREEIRVKLEDEDRPTIIRDIASPAMLTQSRIENIGLITQLPGTGGAVKASSQREKMLDVMRRKNAESPNTFLDSDTTGLAVITTAVPPAAQKGDILDAIVKASSHAEISDLEHGFLIETALTEMSLLGGEVREGFDLAKMQGYIITEEQINGSDEQAAKTQGILVGGGRLVKGRDLGIAVDSEFADAITMRAIVPAINERFTFFNGHKKTGIATPRDSNFIEISVPKKYLRDPYHFVNVVLRIGFNETSEQFDQRLASLSQQLLEPTSVREACWQLEAIGPRAAEALVAGLASQDPEIRFYTAHSLAYLNDSRAIPALKNLCLQEPAFRAMCFNGLVAIDSFEADDALEELLHAADAEVKYGAVLAIRRRDRTAPQVTGEDFEKAGSLLQIASSGPPLVAVSLSQTPEIVLFGSNPELHIPTFQYVNPRILVSPAEDGGLKISCFKKGEDDSIITCPADLISVLAAISEVGGTYGDWVKFVRECHENGAFIEPFAMNPIPKSGRVYNRVSTSVTEPGEPLYEDTFIHLSDTAETENSESGNSWNPFTWAK